MHIACVIPSLRAGGAERVLTRLTAGFVAGGHAVTLFMLQPSDEKPFFAPDPAVAVVGLDALTPTGAVRWGRAVWRLRRAIARARPGVVLGFTTVGGVLAAAANQLAGSPPPLVIAERADPRAHGARIGSLGRAVRTLAHRCADRVVVQTEAGQRALSQVPADRLAVIGNPVIVPALCARPDQSNGVGRFTLIAAGRFVPDKGFDRLIAAFGQLAPVAPDWDLVIQGDGPLRPAFIRQITELGLRDRVHLPGTVTDLTPVLATAHAFVLPSRIEGFANVLAEAAAVGLPAVAYRDVGGVDTLIVEGETGLIAAPGRPIESLAETLQPLLTDATLRQRMGDAARRHVAQFTVAAHDQAWLDLLESVVAAKETRQHDVRHHRPMVAPGNRRDSPAAG